MTLEKDRLAPFVAGTVASITGSIASFAIVVSALSAMGASAPQVSTAVAAMLAGYGVLSIALSFWLRMPVSIAWSTPGAAFLASSSSLGLDFQTAVGAFLVASLLTILAGLWPVLGELVKKIPPQIS